LLFSIVASAQTIEESATDEFTSLKKEKMNLPDIDPNDVFPEKTHPIQRVGADANEELIWNEGDNTRGEGSACGDTTYNAYDNIYEGFINSQNDIDWFYGFQSGTSIQRFVMVVPPNYDYDMEIYDVCGQTPARYCNAGLVGATENCTATVTGDFFIKVYRYTTSGYNPSSPYRLNAHPSGTCSVNVVAGTPSQNVTCSNPITVNNNTVYNNNSVNLQYYFYQDLWYPSNTYHSRFSNGGFSAIPNSNQNYNTTFSPPGSWPENGTYLARAYTFAYCVPGAILTIDTDGTSENVNPSVNCIPCTNECSFVGQTQCSGSYSQTCGNYDADSCLEWNSGTFCSNGCNQSTGQCNTCTSHSYSQCFDNDRYWYNSCGAREDIRQDCLDTTYGPNYCSNDDVYRNVTERGCQLDACYTNTTYPQLVQECGVAGCNSSTNQCNTCTSHDHVGCFNNDVYWYNSCSQVEDMQQDCRISCNAGTPPTCNNGLLGNFTVKAKNSQGTPEQNATVSFRRQDAVTFQFAGMTDSTGNFSFSDLWPFDGGGWIGYEFKVVTASGADCGTHYSVINNEGDTDNPMFRCPIANNNNYLRIQPSGPETINLGQNLQLDALIRNLLSAPISQALVGLIRPYAQPPLSGLSDGAGNVSFQDTGIPAGTHNFQFIASKPNYHYGEAWKKVTVKPQQIPIAVKDNQGKPVPNAKILIGVQIAGFTDATGKLVVDVNQPINTFHALNTDDIDCGYRTVQIGEQANFVCPKNPQLRVDVDNNSGLALANVAVAMDENILDYTDAFGYALVDVNSGSHTIQIYYRMDENRPIFMQEQSTNITMSNSSIAFVASESNGIPVDTNGARIAPLLIVAAYVALDVVSVTLDIHDLCSCLDQQTENPNFDIGYCVNIITSCKVNGVNACKEPLRAAGASLSTCPVQYGALAFDVGPGTGAGIASKLGIGAAFAAIRRESKITKIIDPVISIANSVKRRGEDIWELAGREWNYVVTKIDDLTYHTVIKTRNGVLISIETSSLLKQIAKNSPLDVKAVERVLIGIEKRAIPDSPEYAERLVQYSKISLGQGFEPFADGVHQLKKVYKRTGTNVRVGQQFVQNTIVSKKGDLVTWGNDHVFVYIRSGDTTTRAQQVLQKFPSLQDNDGIINSIKQIIENGEAIPNYSNRFRDVFIDNQGNLRYLEVWLANNHPGSIGTVVIGGLVQ